MYQKKLIFDVVFIKGDEEIFELRFQKLHETVDYFLIFGTKSSLEKIKKYYEVIDYKIKTFTLDENFCENSYDDKFISTKIQETIQELFNTFDDMVFFSFPNEIPDLDSINPIDVKSKDVNILVNDVFDGDFKRKRKYSEIGTILINFSHILKNKKHFLSEIFNMKKNIMCEDLSIRNGFKILNYNKDSKKLSNYYECPFSGELIEYETEKTRRKFVFVQGDNKPDLNSDYTFLIKYINKFPEKISIDFNNQTQDLEIYLPETPLYYENLGDFQLKYKLNEIHRILSVFDCKDDDDVEIYFEDDIIKKLKYSEIKNPSF